MLNNVNFSKGKEHKDWENTHPAPLKNDHMAPNETNTPVRYSISPKLDVLNYGHT